MLKNSVGNRFSNSSSKAKILNLESMERILEIPESSEIVAVLFFGYLCPFFCLFFFKNPWLSWEVLHNGLLHPQNTETTTKA